MVKRVKGEVLVEPDSHGLEGCPNHNLVILHLLFFDFEFAILGLQLLSLFLNLLPQLSKFILHGLEIYPELSGVIYV